MHKAASIVAALLFFSTLTLAATRPHVVSFGKFTPVKWFVGTQEKQTIDLKIRPLYVDTRLKEFTSGPPHEITDRLFVVRRAFRLNDALPDDANQAPRWKWQRGGWLLVDRVSGHVTSINFPEFDPYFSAASWYRDYAAYCGVSDDGKKTFAMVAQVGRRKPILKEALKDLSPTEMPDSACPAPEWDRQPARVTFELQGDQGLTFTVRGHAVEMVKDEEEEAAMQ